MTLMLPTLSIEASTDQEFFKERINGIEFKIPYAESDVYVEKNIDGLLSEIDVFDKETHELLSTFEVEDEEFSPMSNTTLRNVSHVRDDNGLQTRSRARIEVFSTAGFRQINRVLNTGWFAGSGNYTIEDGTADSIPIDPNSFPTTAIRVLGDATIEVATNEEFNMGWEAAGFSIGGSSGGTNYYRKYIEMTFDYSLY